MLFGHLSPIGDKRSPPDLPSEGLFRAWESGAKGQSRTDTAFSPPAFEFVAVRTIRFFQSRCVPQSCLKCTNAFRMTSEGIKYLVDFLVDGTDRHFLSHTMLIPYILGHEFFP